MKFKYLHFVFLACSALCGFNVAYGQKTQDRNVYGQEGKGKPGCPQAGEVKALAREILESLKADTENSERILRVPLASIEAVVSTTDARCANKDELKTLEFNHNPLEYVLGKNLILVHPLRWANLDPRAEGTQILTFHEHMRAFLDRFKGNQNKEDAWLISQNLPLALKASRENERAGIQKILERIDGKTLVTETPDLQPPLPEPCKLIAGNSAPHLVIQLSSGCDRVINSKINTPALMFLRLVNFSGSYDCKLIGAGVMCTRLQNFEKRSSGIRGTTDSIRLRGLYKIFVSQSGVLNAEFEGRTESIDHRFMGYPEKLTQSVSFFDQKLSLMFVEQARNLEPSRE